jgi:hypothetical protein
LLEEERVDVLSLLLVRLDPLGLRVCPEPGFSEGDLGGLGIPDPPRVSFAYSEERRSVQLYNDSASNEGC